MSHTVTPRPADSSTTATLSRADDATPDGATEKAKLDLSLTGVIGSSLAAITAAYLGSKLGVAGTIIGAGLGSVVSAVAAALYTASLRQSRSGLRTAMAQLRPEANGIATSTEVDQSATSRLRALALRLRPHRTKILSGAAVVFVIAIAAITTFETVAGKSLSGTKGDTSVSGVFGAGDTRTPNPSESPQHTPPSNPESPDATPEPKRDTAPTSEPDTTSTPDPAAPSSGSAPTSAAPDATAAPTTEQPAPSTAPAETPAPATPDGNRGGARVNDPSMP